MPKEKEQARVKIELPIRPGRTVVMVVEFGPRRGDELRWRHEETWLGNKDSVPGEKNLTCVVPVQPRYTAILTFRFKPDDSGEYDYHVHHVRRHE
jgi:hypothetical protein